VRLSQGQVLRALSTYVCVRIVRDTQDIITDNSSEYQR